jgi:protein involved in polysaccharide export with SLBB domain
VVRYSRIEIVVAGAVQRAGRTALEPGATVATALHAAGGLAHRGTSGPAGELVLRRRPPTSRSVSVYRWNIFEGDPESWRSFRLEQHDVLVFGWSVREDSV